MKRFLSIIPILGLLLFSVSCSEDDLGDFQKNEPDPEFALFTLLDAYPALRNAFNKINAYEFNDRMCAALNSYPDEVKTVLAIVSNMLTESDTDVVKCYRGIISRILHQDDLDKDENRNREFSYEDAYYSWSNNIDSAIDTNTNERLNLIKPLLGIARKLFGYVNYKYEGEELEKVMEDLFIFLRDDEGTNFGSVQRLIMDEIFGKLYMQADSSIIVDDVDTGLGNGIKGRDASLSGQYDEMMDPAFREVYFDLLREIGNISSASVKGIDGEKKSNEVLKELFCNLENYFTPGDEDDINVFDTDPRYKNNTKDDYVDANLKDIVREFFIMVQQLAKRADKPGAIIAYNNEPISIITKFVDVLKRLELDPDGSYLDERIYDAFHFDVWGRDRRKTGTGGISEEPFHSSYLEYSSLVMNLGHNSGWRDGGITGEFDSSDPNYRHGHGEFVGSFTLNDIVCSMKTKKLGLPNMPLVGIYDLSLKAEDGHKIFRSSSPFSVEERNNYKFFFDQNYPVYMLTFTPFSGDFGVPWGGNPDGGDGQSIEYTNSYRPYSPSGSGETDAESYIVTMFCRSAWWGEGPYYSKNGMIKEGDVYTYYRPNGKIYTQVTKPDLNDDETWSYYYPCDGGNDVEGEVDDEGNPYPEGQRERINNRYHEKANSDYFLFEMPNPVESWGELFGRIIDASDAIIPGLREFFENILGIELGGEDDNWYVTPSDMVEGADEMSDNVKGLLATDVTSANRFVFQELVPEKSKDRECDTNIEAYFRNLNWFCTERKVGMVLPLYINVALEGDTIKALIQGFFDAWGIENESIAEFFGIQFDELLDGTSIAQLVGYFGTECNGIAGLSEARAFTFTNSDGDVIYNTNGAWKKKSEEEGELYYGPSYIPGDYRVFLRYKSDFLLKAIAPLAMFLNGVFEGNLASMLLNPPDGILSEMLWKLFIGDGTAYPGVVAHAMPAIYRMAFPLSVHPETGERIGYIGSRKGNLVPEDHPDWGFKANDDDLNWKNRGGLAITLLPLTIALRDYCGQPISKDEYYTRGEYWKTCSTMSSVKAFSEIVTPAALKPVMYYHEGDENSYAQKTWLPRLIDDHSVFLRTSDVPDSPPGQAGHNSWEEKAYYQPAKVLNVFSMMMDSDRFGDNPKRCDGMFPLISGYDVDRPKGPDNPPNTRLLSRLFKLILVFADKKFDERSANYDENDYKTWSTREKMRYGLEQITTSMKCQKTAYMKKTEDGPKGAWYPDILKMPDHMFTDNSRNMDVSFDKILDELIGSNETGHGIAVFPDTRPNPEDWDNFYKFTDAFAELLSNKGETEGKFNILEDLISLIDKLNTQVDTTDFENTGFRHTVGSLFTEYNQEEGIWEYPDIVIHMVTHTLPEVLEFFKGYYKEFFIITESLLKDDGFAEFLIYTLDSDYSAREVAEQIVVFLESDLIANNDSAFWSDLAEMLTAFSDLIVPEKARTPWDIRYYPIQDNSDLLRTADPFTGLGELLSW